MSKSAGCFFILAACAASASADSPKFTSVQPELFAAPHALSNAFADVDGYGSQSVVPVHFGLAKTELVAVKVTFLTRDGRKRRRLERVDPRKWTGDALVVKAE